MDVDSVIVGYKGITTHGSGVYYAPYIPTGINFVPHITEFANGEWAIDLGKNRDAIVDWCYETLGDGGLFNNWRQSKRSSRIFISKESDLVLFKLKWC